MCPPGSGAPPVEINGQTWILAGDKLWHLSPNHNWQPDRAVDLHMPHMFAGFDIVASPCAPERRPTP